MEPQPCAAAQRQSDGFTYTMNYWMSSYIISRGGKKQTKKAYAYEIHVTKSWNNVEGCMRMSSTPTAWT